MPKRGKRIEDLIYLGFFFALTTNIQMEQLLHMEYPNKYNNIKDLIIHQLVTN